MIKEVLGLSTVIWSSAAARSGIVSGIKGGQVEVLRGVLVGVSRGTRGMLVGAIIGGARGGLSTSSLA